jgi:U4/U6.U5 tri-snRNP-associated protein 2
MVESSTKKELRKNSSDDEFNSSDNEAPPAKRLNANNSSANAHSTLYLDTIDRKRLDFDFEKLCSITLSQLNVYACLVCGKYFQGNTVELNIINIY